MRPGLNTECSRGKKCIQINRDFQHVKWGQIRDEIGDRWKREVVPLLSGLEDKNVSVMTEWLSQSTLDLIYFYETYIFTKTLCLDLHLLFVASLQRISYHTLYIIISLLREVCMPHHKTYYTNDILYFACSFYVVLFHLF